LPGRRPLSREPSGYDKWVISGWVAAALEAFERSPDLQSWEQVLSILSDPVAESDDFMRNAPAALRDAVLAELKSLTIGSRGTSYPDRDLPRRELERRRSFCE